MATVDHGHTTGGCDRAAETIERIHHIKNHEQSVNSLQTEEVC